MYEEPIHIETGKSFTYFVWLSEGQTVHFEPKGEGIESKFIVHAPEIQNNDDATTSGEAQFKIETVGEEVGETFSGVFKIVGGDYPYDMHV